MPPARPSLRILVAEDDAAVARLYAAYAQSRGHSVLFARDGAETLVIAAAELPEPEPVPSVSYNSAGSLLVIGPAEAAVQWAERLAGELALAECVVYLAIAPKSNAVYKAFNEAKAFIKKDGTRPVPMHLRNAPTKLMKELDYGKGYRYAHDEEGGFAAGERYLPDGMAEPGFYRPVERGLEIKIAEKLRTLRALNQTKK